MSDFEKRLRRVESRAAEAAQEKLERNRQLEAKALLIGREVTEYLQRNNIVPTPYWKKEIIGQEYRPAQITQSVLHGESEQPARYVDISAHVKKGEAWHILTDVLLDGYEYKRHGITTESRLMEFDAGNSGWNKAEGGVLSDTDLVEDYLQPSHEQSIKILESDIFAKAVGHLVRTGEPYTLCGESLPN